MGQFYKYQITSNIKYLTANLQQESASNRREIFVY